MVKVRQLGLSGLVRRGGLGLLIGEGGGGVDQEEGFDGGLQHEHRVRVGRLAQLHETLTERGPQLVQPQLAAQALQVLGGGF